MNDYELAAKLTEKNISAIINNWGDGSSDAKTFESLVRLGDSRSMAMASTLNAKYRDEGKGELYSAAYHS